MQFCGVVCHGLDVEHAFAFDIDLPCQLAAVQLEDGQILRRSLDHHLPSSRSTLPLPVLGTMLVAQDGLDGFPVQRRAAAIHQSLESLLHLPADFEQQVPTILDLEVRVLVSESALLLLLQI